MPFRCLAWALAWGALLADSTYAIEISSTIRNVAAQNSDAFLTPGDALLQVDSQKHGARQKQFLKGMQSLRSRLGQQQMEQELEGEGMDGSEEDSSDDSGGSGDWDSSDSSGDDDSLSSGDFGEDSDSSGDGSEQEELAPRPRFRQRARARAKARTRVVQRSKAGVSNEAAIIIESKLGKIAEALSVLAAPSAQRPLLSTAPASGQALVPSSDSSQSPAAAPAPSQPELAIVPSLAGSDLAPQQFTTLPVVPIVSAPEQFRLQQLHQRQAAAITPVSPLASMVKNVQNHPGTQLSVQSSSRASQEAKLLSQMAAPPPVPALDPSSADDAEIKEAMNSEMQRLKYDTAAFKKIPDDLPTAASALGKASVALGLANNRLNSVEHDVQKLAFDL